MTIIISYLAGILTCLSPCILPVLPFIMGSSLQKSRLGPVLLCAGLITSFSILGGILISTGSLLGVSQGVVKTFASILMILIGIILISSKSQEILAHLLSNFSNKADRFLSKFDHLNHYLAQFLVGTLLGILWSPCAGPTLGGSMALAAKDGFTSEFLFSMVAFSAGATTPMLLIAYSTQSVLIKKRANIISASSAIKIIFGWSLLLIGMLTITGFDKQMESIILNLLPDWLINLSVYF